MDVIVVYTYYTYKLARISIIAPAMLEAQKSHMNDLRKFLQEWNDRKTCNNFYEEYKEFHIDHPKNEDHLFRKYIISNWRYKDLVENHLPDECKSKFEGLCEKLAKHIDEYRNERKNLFSLIDEDIQNEFKNNDLDIKIFEHKNFIKFRELCYEQYVSIIDGKPCYDPSQIIFSYENNGNRLAVKSNSFSSTLYTAEPNRDLRLDAQGRHTSPLEKALKEILFNNNRAKKYEDTIKEIINLYGDIEKENNNIFKMIDFLLRYPILPGTKCLILRHLYTNSQLEDFD